MWGSCLFPHEVSFLGLHLDLRTPFDDLCAHLSQWSVHIEEGIKIKMVTLKLSERIEGVCTAVLVIVMHKIACIPP
jgi:hypothetical protein